MNTQSCCPELQTTPGCCSEFGTADCCSELGTTADYDRQVHDAYRLIARHVYRQFRLGEFAYAAFDHINRTCFGGRVPEALILWQLTEHGRGLGWQRSSAEGPPVITLHPSVVAPSGDNDADDLWGVPRELLGWCYAYDVLLHEMLHAHVEYVLGGWEHRDGPQRSKWTCHNNPVWVAECNRLAGLLGLPGRYSLKRNRRVAGRLCSCQDDPDAPDFERFPHDDPARVAFYRARRPPFPWPPAGAVGSNSAQQPGE